MRVYYNPVKACQYEGNIPTPNPFKSPFIEGTTDWGTPLALVDFALFNKDSCTAFLV